MEIGRTSKTRLALNPKSDSTFEAPSLLKDECRRGYRSDAFGRGQLHNGEKSRNTMNTGTGQFEEIKRVLGESKFNIEQSSKGGNRCNFTQQEEPSDMVNPGWRKSRSELRDTSDAGGRPQEDSKVRSKQEEEEREVAAIKAAMKFLNKGIEHSNMLYDWLLGNPKIGPDIGTAPIAYRPHVSPCEPSPTSAERTSLPFHWKKGPIAVLGNRKVGDFYRDLDRGRKTGAVLETTSEKRWQGSPLSFPFVAWESHNDARIAGQSVIPASDQPDLNMVVEKRRCLVKQGSGDGGHHLEKTGQACVSKMDTDTVRESQGCWKSLPRLCPGGRHLLTNIKPSGVDTAVFLESKSFWNSSAADGICGGHWLDETEQLAVPRVESVKLLEKKSKSCCKSSLKTGPGGGHRQDDTCQLRAQEMESQSYLKSSAGEVSCCLRGLEIARQAAVMGRDTIAVLESPQRVRASLKPQAPGGEPLLVIPNQEQLAHRYRQHLSHRKSLGSAIDRKIQRSHALVHGLSVMKPPKWCAVTTPLPRLLSTASNIVVGTEEVEAMWIDGAGGSNVVAASSSSIGRHTETRQETRDSCIPAVSGSLMVQPKTGQAVQPCYTQGPYTCICLPVQDGNAHDLSVSLPPHSCALDMHMRKCDHKAKEFYVPAVSTSVHKAGRVAGGVPVPSLIRSLEGQSGCVPTGSTEDPTTTRPRVLTIRDCHFENSDTCRLVVTEHPWLLKPRTFSMAWPELDSLILEVINDWLDDDEMIEPLEIKETPSYSSKDVSDTRSRTDGEKGGSKFLAKTPRSCPDEENAGMETMTFQSSDYGNMLRTLEGANRGSANGIHIGFQGMWMEHLGNQERDSELVEVEGRICQANSVAALASLLRRVTGPLQETDTEEEAAREFEADETVRLLLEKLRFYEAKIRALKKKGAGRLKKTIQDC